MKKSRWIIILGIIVLAILIYKIGISKIIETLKDFNPWLLPLIVVIFIIPYILAGLNIQILARPYKKLSLPKLVKYVFFTLFYSSFTPGKIADFFVIFYLKKDKISVSKSTIITIFDKAISLIVKAILGIIGAIFILDQLNVLMIGIPIIMVIGIILLFLLISSKKFRGFIIRVFLKKYAKVFKGFSKEFKKYLKNNKKYLFYNLLITLVKIFFETLLLFLLFLSFGESTNFISVLLIFSLLSIINFFMFPVGISGLGIREALGVIMYSAININPAIVFSAYILRLIIVYIANLLTLVMYPTELNIIKKYKLLEKVRFK